MTATAEATADELVARAKAALTAEGLQATPAMRHFGRWCDACAVRGVSPLPVSAEALTRFLLHSAANGVPAAELRNLCESICFAHGKSGLGNRHAVEDTAWRAFCKAMMASAHGAYVSPPPDSELAKRALERDDARRRDA